MNISEPFIHRPAGTSLLAIGLFVLGVVAYRFLPVAAVPRVDIPNVSVGASLPGADPATVATSLVAPLERRLGQIAGVAEMTSVSTLDGGSINLQFDLSRKVDNAARDVMAAINAAQNDLPINLPGPPTYRKVNPADTPIMILALVSAELPFSKVYECADNIFAQRLSQVEGVSQVLVAGGMQSAPRIQMDPMVLASAGFSLEDVRTMLGQVNADSPKGGLDDGQVSCTLNSNDQLKEAADYQPLILTQKNGVPIKLNSMGRVVEGVINARLAGWVGTQRAVLIIVFKQPDANVIETVERVRTVLPQTEKWLPPSVKILLVSDRTQTIRASVNDVQFSLTLSIGLVVMVIFVFLRRFWPTFIASVTVPLALTGTFACMYLLGYSIDNLSLMAVTISVGFVVDDAIVVIENVFRHIEAGERVFVAALTGARQIGFTVISMSTSLVAVFIPLLFMGGLIGRLLHEFAVTLSVAILVSGVISLTLTPMLCSRFLRPEAAYGRPGPIYRAGEAAYNFVLAAYEHALQWVLRHQGFTQCIWWGTLATTIGLYVIVPKGLFPQQDTGILFGSTKASQDISFAAMAELQQRVARIVLADPAVLTMGSFIGATSGSSTLNNGRMFITLKPWEERRVSADMIIARLRKQLAAVPGIDLRLQSPQDVRTGGRLSAGQYQYSLQSSDITELNHWAQLLMGKLRTIPELKDVDSDQQTGGLQANVVVDRDAALRLGVSPVAVDNTLYDAFGQRQVSVIYKQYNQYHVVLEATPEFQKGPDMLDKIYVKSRAGKLVPLSAVARFETGNAYLQVNHQGQFPAITLSFNLAPNVSLGEATDLIQEAKEELHMPARVTCSFQGTAKIYQAMLVNLPMLIMAALVAVYIVLGVLYESLIHPITIISTLPSAGVGALLALMMTGYDFSVVSFIGIVLLMGIVKKNAIMMIDFALEAERQEKLTPEEAIYKACVIRFRPIMMTTMAALLGALPLAMGMGTGSEMRRPLGIAVVGGLILSQALTLFTTPVIYLAFEHARRRVRVWRHPELRNAAAY